MAKPASITLTADQLDQLAERVAAATARRVLDQLAARDHDGLIDAAEVARRFGVTRSFAYDNAARLGAIRLGPGPRARLRFDPARVARANTNRRASAQADGPDDGRRAAAADRGPLVKPDLPTIATRRRSWPTSTPPAAHPTRAPPAPTTRGRAAAPWRPTHVSEDACCVPRTRCSHQGGRGTPGEQSICTALEERSTARTYTFRY